MGKAALRGRGCPAEPAGDWQQPSGPGASRLLGRGRWGGRGSASHLTRHWAPRGALVVSCLPTQDCPARVASGTDLSPGAEG